MSKLIIYHGSDHIIKAPQYHQGKKNNDYGYGFYCTENLELAKEWANQIENINGIVNEYGIDETNLNILDLTDKKYSILNWMAILLKNRTFTMANPINIEAKKYILENFSIDTTQYDIIKGYRADDSYFSFAQDFLDNTISVRQLSRAMNLGKLGIQYVIISQKAFQKLKFNKYYSTTNEYYNNFLKRDLKARKDYKNMKIDTNTILADLYIRDIIKEEIKNGDSRI